MKLKTKQVLKSWTPKLLLDLIKISLTLYNFLRLHRYIKQNSLWENKYDGEVVYIVGNGPSLNNFNLEKIKGNFIITMNHFELHPQKDKLKIVAHCIGEPYESTTWEDPIAIIDGIKAASYWFNADAIPFFKKNKSYIVNYYLPIIGANPFLLKGTDLSRPVIRYQSTSQMAIIIAIFFGFKKIYLLGLDHDWLVTREHSPHFYDERDGVAKGDLTKFTYTEKIRLSLSLFEIYIKISTLAKKQNVKIINLSNPTFLDVFPTKDEIH